MGKNGPSWGPKNAKQPSPYICNNVFLNIGGHGGISMNSSVIRQKGESQNGCHKKTKQAKFSEHF